MITLTIFVGLGTTGTEILKTLRQLMAEEFGHLKMCFDIWMQLSFFNGISRFGLAKSCEKRHKPL